MLNDKSMSNRLINILNLIHEIHSVPEGLTYEQIQSKFKISRRTAERMIKTIQESRLEIVPEGKRPKRWRIHSAFPIEKFNAEQLAVLPTAARMYRKQGMEGHAKLMDQVNTRVWAGVAGQVNKHEVNKLNVDVDAFIETEAFVRRPGPKEHIDEKVMNTIRRAILGFNPIQFTYLRHYSKKRARVQEVYPYGFLHGTRQYLVAYNPEPAKKGFKTYLLSGISDVIIDEEKIFERDENFSIELFLADSFGMFRAEPYEIVWRFNANLAEEIQEWNFHESQKTRLLPDGRIEVSFRASVSWEMINHLFTWGNSVEVVKPKKLKTLYKQRLEEALSNYEDLK